MTINDAFKLENGNLIITGIYHGSELRSKNDIISRIGEKVTIVKPNGDKMELKVKSTDVAVSISNVINVAIELSGKYNEADIPRNALVYL